VDTQQKIKAAWDNLLAQPRSKEQDMAIKNAVLVVVGGSTAYGTATETSDIDIRGIFIADEKYYLGMGSIEGVEINRGEGSESDTFKELREFFNLAADGNPNIVEQMFVRPEHILHITPLGQKLIDNREIFLSKRCRHSYAGYAHQQLKRIEGHYRWIKDPPNEPDAEKYKVKRYRNKTSGKVIPVSDYEAKMQRMFESPEHWEEFMDIDSKSYDQAKKKYEQYLTWKKNRNEMRHQLEKDHGYDTKHASHLVRLLLQGKQILTEHTLDTFLRPDDLQMVRDVRYGKWSYEDLVAYAGEFEQKFNELEQTSTLRKSPEREQISDVCCSITKAFLFDGVR
jgi:predicted nucleotidyltransferase